SDPKDGTQGPYPNVAGLRSVLVNGKVYAFDRQTGKYNWYVPEGDQMVVSQMLLLERFQDLPMMLFTAKFNRPVSGGAYSTPVVVHPVVVPKGLAPRPPSVPVQARSSGNAIPPPPPAP